MLLFTSNYFIMPAKIELKSWDKLINNIEYISEATKTSKMRKCLFKCYCWKSFIAWLWDIRSGKQVSCWCYNIKKWSMRLWKLNSSYKHWLKNTKIYNIRRMMKERCYNINHVWYKRYGGRWIWICSRWLEWEYGMTWVECFFIDMWSIKLPHGTLDRIDSNMDYTPNNCKRSTIEEQNNNKNNSIYINDIPITMFAKVNNINYSTLKYHFYKDDLWIYLSNKWIKHVNSYHKWYR